MQNTDINHSNIFWDPSPRVMEIKNIISLKVFFFLFFLLSMKFQFNIRSFYSACQYLNTIFFIFCHNLFRIISSISSSSWPIIYSAVMALQMRLSKAFFVSLTVFLFWHLYLIPSKRLLFLFNLCWDYPSDFTFCPSFH